MAEANSNLGRIKPSKFLTKSPFQLKMHKQFTTSIKLHYKVKFIICLEGKIYASQKRILNLKHYLLSSKIHFPRCISRFLCGQSNFIFEFGLFGYFSLHISGLCLFSRLALPYRILLYRALSKS